MQGWKLAMDVRSEREAGCAEWAGAVVWGEIGGEGGCVCVTACAAQVSGGAGLVGRPRYATVRC